MTLTQQLEIANFKSVIPIEERRAFEQHYAKGQSNLQCEIESRVELEKLMGVQDPNDQLILEIRELMQKKKEFATKFEDDRKDYERKRKASDEMIDDTFFQQSQHCRSAYQGGTSINLMSPCFGAETNHAESSSISMAATSAASMTPTTHSTRTRTNLSLPPIESIFVTKNSNIDKDSRRPPTPLR